MARSKVESYIGFLRKSGKITLGSGAISTLRGGVYIIIVDGAAAKNTQKLALKYKNRFSCPLVVCESGFEDAVNKPGCKIAAVRDKNLSGAILDNLDENYHLPEAVF
ncbi:MAG: hypothetical protein HDP34_02380 [Clostridia bacterium]|nr:hypothetical protein [Clostridia bacterium]